MVEWSEARQLAAQYHSPGPTGIGFAQFASTGTVTPELWANIRYCEANAHESYAGHWAEDMAKLRRLLDEDGIHEETEAERSAQRAREALQAYYNTHDEGTYGDEGSDCFVSAVQDLLTDLRHLVWGSAQLDFEAIDAQASARYCEELEAEGK